ncbi:hypothetical protein C0V70_01785 [Bacteriovorax stolpii]|uniref:Uncharacterized protein n=1 Tax=Bacteriovorax stolpii TaxID=960 RepID=A0A2K9NP56_BACTC|nr:hypothetical protein [Bacteriovorax stolpii]AUN96855.1 hypothetical protein C0V70_01785 [Bacteriovorax stolpii]TDP53133.1 hypothetical protein C8D79_1774 [Bacteriovorax stolpii]
MNALLKLISLSALAITQTFAGTIPVSKLTSIEKKFIFENHDGELIKYDSLEDQIILDDQLEDELRQKGIIHTEDAVGDQASLGNGGR